MDQKHLITELAQVAQDLWNIPLDEEILNKVLSIAQIKMYIKGEILQGIGERCEYIGIVLSGLVRSYYLDLEGNEITRNFHNEYHLVTDEGLLGYKESICAYEVLEDTTIMLLPNKQLKNLIMENEKLKDLYICSLESGIRYKIYRENAFLTSNATQRYLQFKKDFPELKDRVKQSYISTYLGITPESLSRIRKSLKDVGRQ